MTHTLYLAWRYISYHRFKSAVLITAITLIFYLPIGLRVLVDQSAAQLTARATATPLVVGAEGSPLELVLNTLYFGSDVPATTDFGQFERLADSGFAMAVPIYTRFRSQGHPIVGTSLEYFAFRDLVFAEGRQVAVLGEAVLGARVAEALGVGPGGSVISSPESVFDIAGVYPLKMQVVGVLAFADGPDDDAIFVDVKTAWIIAGIGHGHQDLAAPDAVGGVLTRDGNEIVANASVMQYNEITADNLGSFHFHGELSAYPLTAVIAMPRDQRSSALLRGRFEGADDAAQIVVPSEVMDELLDTVLTVQRFVVAGAIILGIATLASASLVFLLSLRLRRREIDTLFKIGGSRTAVGIVMASEIAVVLLTAAALAAALTAVTSRFGAVAIRALVQM